MLADIFTQPQKVKINSKEYSFQYDHASLAMLEKRTRKSPYEIYDLLISQNQVMISDSIALVACAMLKFHSTEEILDMEEQLRQQPGLWHEVKEPVIAAFLAPMMPPKILRKMEADERSKKKPVKKKSKKKITNG